MSSNFEGRTKSLNYPFAYFFLQEVPGRRARPSLLALPVANGLHGRPKFKGGTAVASYSKLLTEKSCPTGLASHRNQPGEESSNCKVGCLVLVANRMEKIAWV